MKRATISAVLLASALLSTAARADAPSPDVEAELEPPPAVFVPPPPVEDIDRPSTTVLVRRNPAMFAVGVTGAVTGTLVFIGSMFGFITKRTDETTRCNQLGAPADIDACVAQDQKVAHGAAAGMVIGALVAVASAPLIVIGGEKVPAGAPEARLGPGRAELRWKF